MVLLHMVTLGRRVQFLPLKWKKGENPTVKWYRSRTAPKGKHVKEDSWQVDPLSEVEV